MRATTLFPSVFFAAALSGCAAVDDGPAAGSLANPGLKGTSWTLAGFQSMDDSKGTIRPEAGKTYTVNFNADGTVTAQLDCNRGNGRYQEGIANAAGGRDHWACRQHTDGLPAAKPRNEPGSMAAGCDQLYPARRAPLPGAQDGRGDH